MELAARMRSEPARGGSWAEIPPERNTSLGAPFFESQCKPRAASARAEPRRQQERQFLWLTARLG